MRSLGFLVSLVVASACASTAPDEGSAEDESSRLSDAFADLDRADSLPFPTVTQRLGSGDVVEASFAHEARFLSFPFDANAGQTIRASTTGGGFRTVVGLFRADELGRPTGRSIALADACEQSRASACVDLNAPATSRYTLIVRRRDQRGEGAVSVSLSLTDHGVDACEVAATCEARLPPLGAIRPWRNDRGYERANAAHLGRDVFAREGGEAWALARFTYGLGLALVDEDVEVWLDRGCNGAWERLDVVRTSRGDHEPVLGVDDSGGWVYYRIPEHVALAPGRHRILFVATGDHSSTEQLIDVVRPGARVVVSDVDGTLTSSEAAQFVADVLGSDPPDARPGAAALLWSFVLRGYHVYYLTARGLGATNATRAWLTANHFPPGPVNTSFSTIGELGGGATEFKTSALARIGAVADLSASYAIGNKSTDERAYLGAGFHGSRTFLYRHDAPNATRVDDYRTLVPGTDTLPALCAPSGSLPRDPAR